MARVYATAAEYLEYTGEEVPDEGALARASRFLDSQVLRLCRYEVDAEGKPADPVVAAAFAAAVCEQVRWWDETGDELGAAGLWGSVKLGSASMTRASSSSGSPGAGGRVVADAALEALRSPDLTPDRFVLGLVCSS
ncbi:hypothetical protein [Streptomyces odonnellii]|uniref:hypothetical protein n=1 Tax=Streptomyces odonnellii TaxID=1417980 RepID=UPI000624F868|nr:hypothetical protein [Streptomyces odonnellii]